MGADAVGAAGVTARARHLDGQLRPDLKALSADPAFASVRRSLGVYYDGPSRAAAMAAFYARLVRPGARVFDIGSHVGDRIAAFLACGASVIACEPQPVCTAVLKHLYGERPDVTLVPSAVGAEEGNIRFYLNSSNPTVSTAASDFVAAARDADGWREQSWDSALTVPVTTLDALIARYGVPDFVKVDVEGFEADVLSGLSHPVRALSFEFTTIQRSVAFACLERMSRLGSYTFALSLGESLTLETDWLAAQEMRSVIEALDHSANSGDVYAVAAPP